MSTLMEDDIKRWTAKRKAAGSTVVSIRGQNSNMGEPLQAAWHRRVAPQAQRVQCAIQTAGAVHQDREQLSSRQVAAVYDIRNPNQVVVWRRHLDQCGAEALSDRKQGHPNMKAERSCPEPSNMVAANSEQDLREENERLRAEVAYLKKLQALIRLKKSAAPRKRA